MITAILIPHDDDSPLQRVEINAEDLATIQGIVEGSFEVTNLDDPPASIFSNDEAMLWSLPYNLRATLLVWMLAKGLRGRINVAGNALLVGQADKNGRTKSVPRALVKLLLETDTYLIERQHRPDGPWVKDSHTFNNWVEAFNFAIVQEEKYAAIQDTRVLGA
ncbi:hypothetical protein ACFZAD_24405 [Streptomyces iakyrus]|uniref:DUF3846 domain-containing protein n=1 Tax=Streptomyces iakyrus TaxID=68219 RepID=UPI0036E53988